MSGKAALERRSMRIILVTVISISILVGGIVAGLALVPQSGTAATKSLSFSSTIKPAGVIRPGETVSIQYSITVHQESDKTTCLNMRVSPVPDWTIKSWNGDGGAWGDHRQDNDKYSGLWWNKNGDNVLTSHYDYYCVSGETTIKPSVSFFTPDGTQGSYEIKATVSSWDDELRSTVIDTIEIRPPNKPPNADFTYRPTTVIATESVTFDAGSSSDPQGEDTIQRYKWDFDGDGSFDATGRTITHQFSQAGTYSVTLQVVDKQGATDETTTQVTVQEPPQPQAAFGFEPQLVVANRSVTFDASPSSTTQAGGTIQKYRWDFDGDGTFEATGKTVDYRFSNPGNYSVTLQVANEYGATGVVTKLVTVHAPPNPQFVFAPQSPAPRQIILFNASATADPDGTVTTYQWDFNNDGTFEAEGLRAQYAYARPGTYTVVLKVTDSDGISRTQQTTVVVRESNNGSDRSRGGIDIETRRVNLFLKGHKTNVTMGETPILSFSVTNLIANDQPLHVQLLLEVPSGMSVRSTRFTESGSGQYTTTFTVAPGETKGLEIKLQANAPGQYPITGQAVYYLGQNQENPTSRSVTIPVRVRSQTPTTTTASNPGFGIATGLGGIVGVIVLIQWLRRRDTAG